MSLLARAFTARKGLDQEAMSQPFVGGLSYGGDYVPLSELQTWTGLGMSPETALNFITIYQCVKVLAETFASIPLIVYRRLPNGGKERADDHPLYETLHDQANPDMTSFVWRELGLSHAATWGNWYSEIARDSSGRTYLFPIRPDRIIPSFDSGERVYDYLSPTGGRKRLKQGTILHIQGMGSNGLMGFSPIALMRATLSIARQAENYGESVFRNGARPAIVASHPKTLSDPAVDRLGRQMDALRGSGNAGKTVILEEGLTIQEVGFPPEDVEFMSTRLFQKRELAGAYRVPPHKIGDLERATFSNIEHLAIEFIQDAMMPWFVRTEAELARTFFAGTEFFAEFLVDGYLRGDALSRATALQIMRNEGIINGDEWRALENLNPIEDGTGQDYWRPANYVVAGEPPPEPAPAAGQMQVLPAPPLPQLTAGDQATRAFGPLRCPACNRLLVEVAPPGTKATCRCKTEAEVPAYAPDRFPGRVAVRSNGENFTKGPGGLFTGSTPSGGGSGGSSPGEAAAIGDFRETVGANGWPESGEKAAILEPGTGRILFEKDGGPAEVDLAEANDQLKGNIVMHSHPGREGMGLSDGDIRTAVVWNVAELRAETATISSVLRPGQTDGGKTGNPWSPDRSPAETRDLAMKLWNDTVDAQFADAPLGEFPDIAAFVSNANRATAERFGWDYSETPR